VSVLDQSVFSDGQTKRFGDMTQAEVAARAAELRMNAGAGPLTRVMPVAMAWAELARTMEREGAPTVAELGEEAVDARAQRLWVVALGGSLLH
jgi:hypothetical protein